MQKVDPIKLFTLCLQKKRTQRGEVWLCLMIFECPSHFLLVGLLCARTIKVVSVEKAGADEDKEEMVGGVLLAASTSILTTAQQIIDQAPLPTFQSLFLPPPLL